MSNINKIRLSGTTYSIQDLNATKTVELTQAQYDALSVKDPNTFYIITDATAGDLSNYYTKTETDGLLDTKFDVTAYTPTDLSNYYTKTETSGATEISTALESKADTATTYTKTETDNAITAATSTKQDTLVSGTNIKTINGESILGEGNITIQGGGDVTVDTSLNSGSINPIANSVVPNNTLSGGVETNDYLRTVRFKKNNGQVAFYKRFAAINGNSVMVDGTTTAPDFKLVETSAITTSISSSSTDAQVPSAKAVYDMVGNINTILESI